MTDLTRLIAFREAGHVSRMHAGRILGTYDVAQHSYNALSLLLVLNPEASTTLIRAVLWHDVPERFTGDLPHPIKVREQVLRTALGKVDVEIELLLGIPLGELDESERKWLSAVDSLEFFMWCCEQETLGNTRVRYPKQRMLEFLVLTHWIPENVKNVVAEILENGYPVIKDDYPWTRIP